MKKSFILIVSLLVPCFMQAIKNLKVVHDTQDESVYMLWKGIQESKPDLVQKAIKLNNGAVPSVRFGPVADPPLMAALRVYCNYLVARSSGELTLKQSTRIALSLLTTSITSGTCYYFTRSISNTLNCIGLTFFITYLVTSLSYGSSEPAQVVELLIKADPNLSARNKEGLDALGILRAYYAHAYQMKDENWMRFLHILMQKNGNSLPEDTLNDLIDAPQTIKITVSEI